MTLATFLLGFVERRKVPAKHKLKGSESLDGESSKDGFAEKPGSSSAATANEKRAEVQIVFPVYFKPVPKQKVSKQISGKLLCAKGGLLKLCEEGLLKFAGGNGRLRELGHSSRAKEV